jgi:hypothetical protein
MRNVGGLLAGGCARLGTLPVALFTNGAVVVLQKFAECGSLQDACRSAGLPMGVAIPVACVLGALGVAAAANALDARAKAARAAEEFRGMKADLDALGDGVESTITAVEALRSTLATHGVIDRRLTGEELERLYAALRAGRLDQVEDGTAQRMMVALEAAGLATAEGLAEVETSVKGTWATSRDVWERQKAHDARFAAFESRLFTDLGTPSPDVPDVFTGLRTILKNQTTQPAVGGGAGGVGVGVPKTNLSDMTLSANADRFKGRTRDLAALHERITTDPPGLPVPVIAEPGLGKSALVTRYVGWNMDAFDHVWWVRAAGRAGAGGGTALEVSVAELLTVWGIDSAAIRGDERTTRLDALAAAARAWLARPKADGTPVRHLLVLDNVEDAATLERLTVPHPGRVVFTARAAHLCRGGAGAYDLKALDPEDGLLVLTAKVTAWNPRPPPPPPPHHDALTRLGGLVGWNALALTYLAAVIARHKTGLRDPAAEILAPLEAALSTALAAGKADPIVPRHAGEEPTDYPATLEEAFAQFVAPYAGTPAMAVLDAAAYTAPDAIPLTLLRDASGLDPEAFDAALMDLAGAGVVEHDADTASVHRLTQVGVRGQIAARGDGAGAAVLKRLLDTLIELFRVPADAATYLLDHVKTPARVAAWPHAEAALTAAGAAWILGTLDATAARLHAELASKLLDLGQLDAAARHLDAVIAHAERRALNSDVHLYINYATRAEIRRDLRRFAEAHADIDAALAWCLANQPNNERSLGILRAIKASIDKAEGT